MELNVFACSNSVFINRVTTVLKPYLCFYSYGEIDLIVSNRNFLVFVEVKLRKNARFENAREYVDFYKQNRIRTTAELYLSQYPTQLQPRFDVIEIYAPQGLETQNPEIYHLEDAFQ